MVSGGSDSISVEVINFHNVTGCDLHIPDIPKSSHGEVSIQNNCMSLKMFLKNKLFTKNGKGGLSLFFHNQKDIFILDKNLLA